MENSPATLVVELDGSAGSVRGARREARRFLTDAALQPPLGPDICRDVLMVVGELVANACRHAPGPCRLSVAVEPDSVDVAVQDTGPDRLGVARRRSPPGYGLWIVARLSQGIEVLPVPDGKVVRAVVPRSRPEQAADKSDDAPTATVLEFPGSRDG
ncbi:ATP-binding protein, partial [Yinghuangia sp. YIM S10712]|uniref:ATP-binding protein n=1 Tax=Yinghuangia sp. YIM S10712 TaxID=3436930 RepID=UPI003F52B97E